MGPVVCSPSGPSSRQSERRVLQQEERWLVLTKVLKKQGHRSQSHTLHGGVTPATNGNHPASSPLCLAAILALSCACLGSKVKPYGQTGSVQLCDPGWRSIENTAFRFIPDVIKLTADMNLALRHKFLHVT